MAMIDMIDRQAAIETVEKWFFNLDDNRMPKEVLLEISSAQPEPQWIPCSERLPKDVELGEEYPTVIFCNSKGTVYVGFCEYSIYGIRWWNTTDWEDVVDNVIAWMPLPEPYKERRADDSF